MNVTPCRLKHLTVGPPQYGLNISADEYRDSGARLLRTSDIDDSGNLSQASPVYVAAEVAVEAPLCPGDILLLRSGTVGRAFRITQDILPVTHAGYLVRFRPSPDAAPRFLEWAMRSRGFADQVALAEIQSTISNVNARKYASMFLPAPPIPTQRKIADFLDRETERIDALVDKKRRLIDLLEEKRTATITQAVTKGLDPTAPMKPSNIPWIGSIPEHWGISTLGRITANLDSQRIPLSSEERALRKGHFPYYGASRIVDYVDDFLFDEPLLLLGEDGAQLLNQSVPIAQLVDGKCWVNNHAYVLRVTQGSRGFLHAYLNVFDRATFVEGATRPKLTQDSMNSIPVPFPPALEQALIAEELAEGGMTLERVISRVTTQLSLLAEYREALITAAVTGEINVDTFENDRHMEEATS